MAKLQDNSRVYGSLIIDGALLGTDGSAVTGDQAIGQSGRTVPSNGTGVGPGNQNMVVFTTGTSVVYSFPTAMQVPGLWVKVTMIAGGGQGGGSTAVVGACGGGATSGGVLVGCFRVELNVYTLTYTIGVGGSTGLAGATGQAGTNSTLIYNGITSTATGGTGGASNGAGGATGTGTTYGTNMINLLASSTNRTNGGNGGIESTTYHPFNKGGDTAFKYGRGGLFSSAAAGSTGSSAQGYGAGGGGARSGTSAVAFAGGAGGSGIIILEY